MKVLVNAYACSPNMGSEPGVGWNWCSHLAKYCELYIITEGEFKEKIEAILPSLPQGKNMHFYYNPVSDEVRRMCWNQGDWRFYIHYRQWQIKTLEIAKQICRKVKIDIIHQLNMTGFREPGYLWKIDGPKFVWGPVDGMNLCPINYIKGIDSRTTAKYIIKNFLNWVQFRTEPRIKKAAKRSDLIFCDSYNGVNSLKKVYDVESLQINETGCTVNEDVRRERMVGKEQLDILWVGRFIPTKLLDLAFKTLSKLDNECKVKLHILGSGNLEAKYKLIANELNVEERCVWHGQIPHDEVERLMRTSDLFFFTSVIEGTPASIMECISNGLPILCFDACGFGPMVDESIGIKIKLTNPEQSAQEFAEKIAYLYKHRDILQTMSDNCKEKIGSISWDALAERLYGLYKTL